MNRNESPDSDSDSDSDLDLVLRCSLAAGAPTQQASLGLLDSFLLLLAARLGWTRSSMSQKVDQLVFSA